MISESSMIIVEFIYLCVHNKLYIRVRMYDCNTSQSISLYVHTVLALISVECVFHKSTLTTGTTICFSQNDKFLQGFLWLRKYLGTK